jgi:predicted DNA binding CopG/RHH family protein
MRESLKPKAMVSPDQLILQKMSIQPTQPVVESPKTIGKHRLNLALPAELFDELREESSRKGLTVTAYLITLIHKALDKE